jgi:hypothetical protein
MRRSPEKLAVELVDNTRDGSEHPAEFGEYRTSVANTCSFSDAMSKVKRRFICISAFGAPKGVTTSTATSGWSLSRCHLAL